MRGFLFFVPALCALVPFDAMAQTEKQERLDSVVVSSSRAGSRTPVAYTMVWGEELKSSNPMKSLPELLSFQPSVVTYNEGGTGLGNSAITIRGTKGSQINVTLNGITLNDQESQEVFWVNIPSLSSIISSVQVQRGLGTTANGAGAFGASINMSTETAGVNPSARASFSYGSWNTLSAVVSAGTGITRSGFYANFVYSRNSTDGYIRNAFVRSQSALATVGWMRGSNSLKLTWLMGDQRSGITWDGIDYEMYKVDRRYNGAGEYHDEAGNVCYYDNQTDNYVQNHFQLNYTHRFSDELSWTSTLDYTRGDGYDEYYKEDKKLKNYGFDFSSDSRSDVIYRKKMGNNYWVLNSDLKYRRDKINLTAGANFSFYHGDHWGEFLWAKLLGDNYDYSSMNSEYAWYFNDADKKEADLFARTEYSITDKLTAFSDLQLRLVHLDMDGRDDDFHEYGGVDKLRYNETWTFLNPRAGLTYVFADGQKIYGSVSVGNREPGRSDIKENIKGTVSPIKPETMVDTEIGYSYMSGNFSVSANIYLMEYWNMLLETGRLSSSGYAIKENVDRAWRRGVELSGAWRPAGWLRLDANVTLSDNRIKDYTSYVAVVDDEWNYTGDTEAFNWGRTTMLLSPSVTGMMHAGVKPWFRASSSFKTFELNVDGKYVGRQYIDNTSRSSMEIPSWFVMNAGASQSFSIWKGMMTLSAYVGNMLNRKYWAYGWRWEDCLAGATKDEIESGIGVYPQAPVNFMFKVSYSF